MAFPVSARTTGELITAAIWNADVRDNLNALRAGGIALASQAAHDFIHATSATQLGRVAAVAGKSPRLKLDGSAWEMVSVGDPLQAQVFS
jgi:hypothetical protein